MAAKAKVVTMKLADLKPAPYNPRSISADALDALTASLERFGLVEPIIVNIRTGYIVGGHQRLEALRRLGKRSVMVVQVDLDATEEKALNLTLNNPAVQGQFTEGLGAILEELADAKFDALDDLQLPALTDLLEYEPMDGLTSDKKTISKSVDAKGNILYPVGFRLTETQLKRVTKALIQAGKGDMSTDEERAAALVRICNSYVRKP